MLLTTMGQSRENIMETPKNQTIKPRRGQQANTVIVKIRCAYDPSVPEAPTVIGWSALINWKKGDMKDKHLYGGNLLELVRETVRLIKDRLIDLEGIVQEVDVIYKMPCVDHKATITFKSAMRSVHFHGE